MTRFVISRFISRFVCRFVPDSFPDFERHRPYAAEGNGAEWKGFSTSNGGARFVNHRLLMCIEAALMRMAHDRPPDTPQRGFMELVRAAEAEAGGGELQPKHLLLAVCAEQDNELAEALAALGIGMGKVREALGE